MFQMDAAEAWKQGASEPWEDSPWPIDKPANPTARADVAALKLGMFTLPSLENGVSQVIASSIALRDDAADLARTALDAPHLHGRMSLLRSAYYGLNRANNAQAEVVEHLGVAVSLLPTADEISAYKGALLSMAATRRHMGNIALTVSLGRKSMAENERRVAGLSGRKMTPEQSESFMHQMSISDIDGSAACTHFEQADVCLRRSGASLAELTSSAIDLAVANYLTDDHELSQRWLVTALWRAGKAKIVHEAGADRAWRLAITAARNHGNSEALSDLLHFD